MVFVLMINKHKVLLKMYTAVIIISFQIICVVKSEDFANESMCKDQFMDMNDKPINVTHYCRYKSCITKCCGNGEILNSIAVCENATNFENFYSQINYTNITLYSWKGSEPMISHKKLTQDLVFVQNQKFLHSGCSYSTLDEDFKILENGSIIQESDSPPWIDLQARDYCVDFIVYQEDDEESQLLFIFKQMIDFNQNSELDIKSKYIAIGMLTSCFFFLLVLAVYCLLPQLRNIVGMILMGYVWSVFLAFLLKAILTLIAESIPPETCKIFSPFVYYAELSSFFWLNIMSFDVWWTFRGTRKCRDIHRRGEVVKFLWYCLYAWGAPLGLVVPAVIVDNTDCRILKPPFDSCLADMGDTRLYYLQVPRAIICGVNIILFLMTAYNIWLVKCAFHNSQDSRKSKKEENRLIIYIKLAVMMGVGWFLDLIPDESMWMFILVNFYNMLMGVIIFFLFVFKKSVLVMLCKRFGINNEFVTNLESRHSRSGTTKYTRASTLKHSKRQTQESTC